MRRRLKVWWCQFWHCIKWEMVDTSAYYCPICQEYRDL